MPEAAAKNLVTEPPGVTPDSTAGEVTVMVRLCTPCADKSDTGMKPGLVPNVPLYSPLR
ncbi:hypothetical protein [Actinokineospora iranica]|uniref:hypothetical protein n=1 Tax=Actinokineospora iranica TaxID=1271860 RepID=UPI001587A4B0|nr:hypothetical protein [Actinokineospora iranica]